MGPGDDRLFGNPTNGEAPPGHELVANNEDPSGLWQAPAQDWNMSENILGAGDENFFDGNMDGGLYWLWDMTWTGSDR